MNKNDWVRRIDVLCCQRIAKTAYHANHDDERPSHEAKLTVDVCAFTMEDDTGQLRLLVIHEPLGLFRERICL